MSDIELRQLRYFVAVAEELNFTRAAERLQIAQPPLSRQIQALEKALGVELLERSQRRVELTAAGNVFLEECRRILAQVNVGVDRAQRTARGETGQLSIGFEGSSQNDLLLQAVRVFHAQFPAVELVLQELSSGEQVEALRRNQIELGFLEPNLPADNLSIEILRSESLVAVLAETHALADQPRFALAQLAEDAWITGSSKTYCGLLIQILNACRQAGFVPQIRNETNDIQMLLGFVAAGLGVTLLPASMQKSLYPGVVYRPLAPPVPKVELAIARHPDNRSPVLNAFLQVVRALPK
ncbi:LysR substrate-binding domain-containing protein [Vacuolonema iberomarrocanum]|uniref:LysR substrate-binding domain-containing protein n=1 Tax=Vacuolonema iberomarrocanum TaxID=3454632 RepID=UPI0019F0B5C4|nr:LysR family transcriptional regulator [filamentous cyanobacterium LEGE 07170]